MLTMSRRFRLYLPVLLFLLSAPVPRVLATTDPAAFSPLLDSQWQFTIDVNSVPTSASFSFASQTAMGSTDLFLQGTRTDQAGYQEPTSTYFSDSSSSFLTYVWDSGNWGWATYVYTVNTDTASGLFGIYDPTFSVLYAGPFTLSGTRSGSQAAALDFSVSQMQGQAPLTVTLTAAPEFSSWSWELGDGSSATSASVNHTYTTPGLYTVSLTATTGSGPSQTVTKENLVVVSDSAGVVPGNHYRFERAWPTLQQPWYFSSPRGLAFDREGYLYLADAWNNRVSKFTGDGQFVTSFGSIGTADGQFLEPAGVALDNDGGIYVTDKCFDRTAGQNGAYDFEHCRVQKFDRQGQFVASWREVGGPDDLLQGPTGITVAPDGTLLVADTLNNRIVHYTATGQLLGVLSGFGGSTFNKPTAAVIREDGTLFVLDGGNNSLHQFSSFAAEAWVTSWDGSQSGTTMSAPASLIRDRAGNLLITDFYNNRILQLSPAGELTVLIDQGQGTANGQFENPVGIAADREGNLYIDDYYGHRLQKFSKQGTFLTAWSSWGTTAGMLHGPHALAVVPAGTVFVADSENFRIAAFSGEGSLLTTWGSKGAADGQFGEGLHKGPHAVVATADRVIVADTYNHRIQEFTSQGAFVKQWGAKGSAPGQFNGPAGVALDGANNLFVVEWGGNRVQKFDAAGTPVGQWGGEGSGNGQFNAPHGIALDPQGMVYVADTLNHRIQKFDGQGHYLGQWGGLGSGDGELYQPWDVAVDSDGNVLVADTYNDRICRFTPQGVFLGHIGASGTMPGQFRQPQSIAIGPQGELVVAEYFNNRVQKLKKVALPGHDKAIVVAGGGPFRGNYLWDATRSMANFAYRALGYRGFGKDAIRFFAADPTIDLDGNGLADDVAGEASAAPLQQAIVDWAQDADNLLIYLVDHGGEGTFRLNDHELLDAATLGGWIDQLQQTMTGRVTTIIDACQSGSFVAPLAPAAGEPRVVITSTQPLESAYFINQGAISFSTFFWTHLFNGHDLHDSFTMAEEAITQASGGQHPLLDGDGDGVGTSQADLTAATGVTVGSAGAIGSQAPVITGVNASAGEDGLLTITAEIGANGSGIARVWAVIRPPGYQAGTLDTPVQGLPTVELLPQGSGLHGGTFQATSDGTYTIAVQAKDTLGNTSSPQITQVAVGAAMHRRAIIVAGGPASGTPWPAVRESARLAYQALRFQGYAEEDITVLAPEAIPSLAIQPLLPTPANLEYLLTTWSAQQTEDLVLFLVGEGDSEHFFLDQGVPLPASTLDGWLDANSAQHGMTVVGDFNLAGDFLPRLSVPPGQARILVASAGPGQSAHLSAMGDISFSRFFWREVLNGRTVWDAFVEAKRSIAAATRVQQAWLDDNGDGGDATVGSLARFTSLGMGIRLAANEPQAQSVNAEQTLTGGSTATLFVDTVTASQPLTRVWAVISPPDPGQQYASLATELPTVELPATTAGHYQADWSGFTLFGSHGVAIYAQTEAGTVALLKETGVVQQAGSDAYEPDDLPANASILVLNDGPQHHSFYPEADSDWGQFYGLATVPYDVRVSQAGAAVDAVITIHDSDGQTVLVGPVNDTGLGENELITDWTPPHNGIYYVKVGNLNADPPGAESGYDLEIGFPTAPEVGVIEGFVLRDTGMTAVAGAIVVAGSGTAITRNDGSFRLVADTGTVAVQAESALSEPASAQVQVTGGQVIQTTIVVSETLATTTTLPTTTTTTTAPLPTVTTTVAPATTTSTTGISATTTTTTIAEGSTVTLPVGTGWSLLSSTIGFTATTVFADAAKFTSVWKWQGATWAVYLPGESSPGAYALAKGFTPLDTINPGEGFWVHAALSSSVTISGVPVYGELSLTSGWNLVGLLSGQAIPVADFIVGKPEIVSLWKWQGESWAVYLPGGDGGASYAAGKGFALMTAIAPQEGFWVNRQ